MRKINAITKSAIVLAISLMMTVCLAVLVGLASSLFEDYANGVDINKTLTDIVSYTSIILAFSIVLIVLLTVVLINVYIRENNRDYSAQLTKLVALIDQQTSPDKIEFYADRLIKFIAKTAIRQKINLKSVYTGLSDLYLVKAMKTAEEIDKFKEYMAILLKSYADSNNLQRSYNSVKIQKIVDASILYDIGKLAIPGYLLYKETTLTQEEYEIVKRHVKYGYDLICAVKPECALGSFEQYARDIVGYHHERYDGKGYIYALAGDNIPFLARVLAVVMCYDAVTKNRPFKKAMAHEDAVLLINNEKGLQFDPKIVKAFNAVEQEFKRINERGKNTYTSSSRSRSADPELFNIPVREKYNTGSNQKKEDESFVDYDAIYKEYGIDVAPKEEKKTKLSNKKDSE